MAVFFFICSSATVYPASPDFHAPELLILEKSITIKPRTTLLIQNTVIINLAEHPFVLSDNSSAVMLENCSIVLSKDYAWTTGTLMLKGTCHILGPHIWHQENAEACIVMHKGTLVVGGGATFYYEPTSENQAGIILADHSSTLLLNGGHLRSGHCGLMLTSGIVAIEGTCTLHAENNLPSHGIIFGSGKSYGENVTLKLSDPSARLMVTSPYFQEKKYHPFTRKALKFLGNAALALVLCGGVAVGTTKLLRD